MVRESDNSWFPRIDVPIRFESYSHPSIPSQRSRDLAPLWAWRSMVDTAGSGAHWAYRIQAYYLTSYLLINKFPDNCQKQSPVAITLRSLQAYRQTHQTCPRYSVDALAKTLCQLHNVCVPSIFLILLHQLPCRSYLQKQLLELAGSSLGIHYVEGSQSHKFHLPQLEAKQFSKL